MNINGTVRDRRSGAGIGDVSVSNGESVARTNPDGSYRLPFHPGEHVFIWVSLPDGFECAGPFYRSPGAAEGSVDFFLAPRAEPSAPGWRMAQLTDFHLFKDSLGPEHLRADISQVLSADAPDFAVISGDLTDMGSAQELRSCGKVLQESGLEMFPMFGGHDGKEELIRNEKGTTCTRNYEQVFGPAYYSFNRAGRHFVLYPDEDRYFAGPDRERKARWLRADLAGQPSDRASILFIHATPPRSFVEEMGRLGVVMLLFGHRHSNKWYEWAGVEIGCCPSLSFGGTDYSARGYRMVDFTSTAFTTRLVALKSQVLESVGPSGRNNGEKDAANAVTSSDRIPLPGGQLRRRWQHRLPGYLHLSEPVQWLDAFLVSIDDQYGSGDPGLRCIDGSTGATRWQLTTETGIQRAPAVAESGFCAVIAPAGRLYGIDTDTGQLRWDVCLPGYPERWIYSSPRVAADRSGTSTTVFAGSNAGFGAFDGETGDTRWYHSFVGDTPRVIDKPSRTNAVIYGDQLILLIPKRGLVALDRNAGRLVWELPLGVHHYWATPIVTETLLITGGDPGKLAVVAPESGRLERQWELPDGAYPTALAADAQRSYVALSNGKVCSYGLSDGRLLWTFASAEALVDMVPARRGGASALAAPRRWRDWLLVAGGDGLLHILDPATGEPVQRIRFDAPLTATPCTLQDGFCVGSLDGRLSFLTL